MILYIEVYSGIHHNTYKIQDSDRLGKPSEPFKKHTLQNPSVIYKRIFIFKRKSILFHAYMGCIEFPHIGYV